MTVYSVVMGVTGISSYCGGGWMLGCNKCCKFQKQMVPLSHPAIIYDDDEYLLVRTPSPFGTIVRKMGLVEIDVVVVAETVVDDECGRM